MVNSGRKRRGNRRPGHDGLGQGISQKALYISVETAEAIKQNIIKRTCFRPGLLAAGTLEKQTWEHKYQLSTTLKL